MEVTISPTNINCANTSQRANYTQHCEKCVFGFTGFCTKYNEMTNVCRPESCPSYRPATQKDIDDAAKMLGKPKNRHVSNYDDAGGVPPIVWLLIVVGIIVAIAYLK